MAIAEQLTRDEMALLLSVVPHLRTQGPTAELERKLQAGIDSAEKHAKMAKIRPEKFVSTISREDAEQYDELGQHMMLAAGKARIPEGQHAKLTYLMIGLTSALCQVMRQPREPFCTELVSNVMFSALKAAYTEGGGPTLDPPDVPDAQ